MKARIASNLTVKVGGTMAAVVVLAVGLATFLNLMRFQETYERLVAQRLEVLAGEIGRTLAVGVGLGVRVEAQGNLPDLLRQQAGRNPDVAAIIVHDCKGHPIERQGWDAADTEPWLDHLDKTRWHVFDPAGLVVGLTVKDTLGTCLAGVVLRKSAASYVSVIDQVTGRFIGIGAIAAVLAVFSVMAAAFYFDDRRRALLRLEADVAGIAAGSALPLPPKIAMDAFGNRWERSMVGTYLEARPELLARAAQVRAGADEATSR
jgi:hypothetical protein